MMHKKLEGRYIWSQIIRAPKSLQMVAAAMKLRHLLPGKKSYDQPRQHIKKQRHYFAKVTQRSV